VAVSVGQTRGAYSSSAGDVYFDGQGWFGAINAGGVWIPDPGTPHADFDPVANAALLIYAEEGAAVGLQLPRGPAIAPDYVPMRDCGNCGFDLGGQSAECQKCGTANVGPQFIP
jgi:hypothetical protein